MDCKYTNEVISMVLQVSSEHLYYWLSALHQCSMAEMCLVEMPSSVSAFTKQLNQAQTFYLKAISSLRVCITLSYICSISCAYSVIQCACGLCFRLNYFY